VAPQDVVAHRGTAQIERPVLHAHLVRHVLVAVDRERRRGRRRKHGNLVGDHLDGAGFELVVARAFRPYHDVARNLHRPFRPQVLGCGVRGRLLVQADAHLRQAVAVAQIDEYEAALVATTMNPARERNALAGVVGAQVAAGVGTKSGGMHFFWNRSPRDRCGMRTINMGGAGG